MLEPLHQHLSSLDNFTTSPSPLRILVPTSLQPFLLLSYPSHSNSFSSSGYVGAHHGISGSAAGAVGSGAVGVGKGIYTYASNAGSAIPISSLLASTIHEYPALTYFREKLLSFAPAVARQFSYPQAIAHAHAHAAGASARNPGPLVTTVQETLYGKGPADIAFVIFCAIAFTIIRHLAMEYVFAAFARVYLARRDRGIARANRARRKKAREGRGISGGVNGTQAAQAQVEKPLGRRKRQYATVRFAEQAWAGSYATCSWITGLIVLSRLPAPLSPQSFWASYPVTLLPRLSKFYYLAQLGWWFHQIYVINAEKRRADHWQMFAHHCLTIGLVVASYLGNFTRIGTVLHVFMDTVDILLCTAKCLRYLLLTTICDLTFVAFLVTWLVTRQIGLPYLIFTATFESHRMISPKWAPEEGIYLTRTTMTLFILAMMALLVLCTVWFTMAVKVAVRVVRGQGAEDSRSDDEDEGEGEGGEESDDWTSEDATRTSITGTSGEGKEKITLDDVPGKGVGKAKTKAAGKEIYSASSASANASGNSNSSAGSAGKTLSGIAERVGCKRDTLKDEAVRRRR